MAHTPLHKRLATGHKPQLLIKAHSLQPSVHRHTVRALFGGSDSIRDYIAFPKNNQGRDVMIDSPSTIDQSQLDELHLDVRKSE